MDSLGSDFISRGKLILKIKEKIKLGFPGSSDGKKKKKKKLPVMQETLV